MEINIIDSNGCPPQLVNDLKDRIDTLTVELQEMRDNLAQCSCSEDASVKPVEAVTGEHEGPLKMIEGSQ